jgi:hypothetical protein
MDHREPNSMQTTIKLSKETTYCYYHQTDHLQALLQCLRYRRVLNILSPLLLLIELTSLMVILSLVFSCYKVGDVSYILLFAWK